MAHTDCSILLEYQAEMGFVVVQILSTGQRVSIRGQLLCPLASVVAEGSLMSSNLFSMYMKLMFGIGDDVG